MAGVGTTADMTMVATKPVSAADSADSAAQSDTAGSTAADSIASDADTVDSACVAYRSWSRSGVPADVEVHP